MDNEARRFQTLIKETERRFGGREEPVRVYYCIVLVFVCSVEFIVCFRSFASSVVRVHYRCYFIHS